MIIINQEINYNQTLAKYYIKILIYNHINYKIAIYISIINNKIRVN
jgi:hypothetical protein